MITAALLGRSKAVALESQITLRLKKRCSAVLESRSIVWRRLWTVVCAPAPSPTGVAKLAELLTFLFGFWDGGSLEREGLGWATGLSRFLFLLLSDILPAEINFIN